MKKSLCMIMVFVLCFSMFTYTVAEKNVNIPVTVSFGPFYLELPEEWEVVCFDAENEGNSLFGKDDMYYDFVSSHLELESSDGCANIIIDIIDAHSSLIEHAYDIEESAIGAFFLKNFASRDASAGIMDKEMLISGLIKQAEGYGKSSEDIFECRIGDYDFAGFTHTGADAAKRGEKIDKDGYETIVHRYGSFAEGYMIHATLFDRVNNHSSALYELFDTFRIDISDQKDTIAVCGPVSFDTHGKWKESFRWTKQNWLQAEFVSESNADSGFFLTICDMWMDKFTEKERAEYESNGRSRNDMDSLEAAIAVIAPLAQEAGKGLDEIETLKAGEYDICRLVLPTHNTLSGRKVYNVPVYSAIIDGYWIHLNLYTSADTDEFCDFTDTLNTLNINIIDSIP